MGRSAPLLLEDGASESHIRQLFSREPECAGQVQTNRDGWGAAARQALLLALFLL